MDEERTVLQLQQARAHQQILPRQMKDNLNDIQSITAQMGPEEKEEFLDEAEKEGF